MASSLYNYVRDPRGTWAETVIDGRCVAVRGRDADEASEALGRLVAFLEEEHAKAPSSAREAT